MKIFLYPFSGLYWAVTYIRNKFFDWGILSSKNYKKPVIAIGNLSVGGTGKSPFVIYLINLLKEGRLIGIVSRGYGRETKGYHFANYDTTFEQIGDEPMQFFERFRNKIVIGVDEKRVRAINNLQKDFNPDLFIMDDGFQHRYVKARLTIMLTDYHFPYYQDTILPVGRLREGRYGAKRAQIIVVTKCPETLNEEDKKNIKTKLKLESYQSLFFSKIVYEKQIVSYNLVYDLVEVSDYKILLITGIAKYDEILDFAQQNFAEVIHFNFKDHHNFTEKEVGDIENTYKSIIGERLILTTEKDYMRLKHFQRLRNNLFYLPINIELDKPEEFKKLINKNLK